MEKNFPAQLAQHVLTTISSDDGENTNSVESKVDCSICLEPLMPNDAVRKLRCGHIFHVGCLDPWARINASCANCRQTIIAPDVTDLPVSDGPPSFRPVAATLDLRNENVTINVNDNVNENVNDNSDDNVQQQV